MPEFYARKRLPKWSSCLSGQKTNKLLNVQEGFLGFLFITAFRTIRIISNADVDVAEIKGDKHTKTTLHATFDWPARSSRVGEVNQMVETLYCINI